MAKWSHCSLECQMATVWRIDTGTGRWGQVWQDQASERIPANAAVGLLVEYLENTASLAGGEEEDAEWEWAVAESATCWAGLWTRRSLNYRAPRITAVRAPV